MIVYTANKKDFIEDVRDDKIDKKILTEFKVNGTLKPKPAPQTLDAELVEETKEEVVEEVKEKSFDDIVQEAVDGNTSGE